MKSDSTKRGGRTNEEMLDDVLSGIQKKDPGVSDPQSLCRQATRARPGLVNGHCWPKGHPLILLIEEGTADLPSADGTGKAKVALLWLGNAESATSVVMGAQPMVLARCRVPCGGGGALTNWEARNWAPG